MQNSFRSSKEKIEKQEQELSLIQQSQKTLFDCLAEGIIVLNQEQKIREINSKAAKILETSKHFVLGKDFKDLQIPKPEILEKTKYLIEKSHSHDSIMSDSIEIKGIKKVYLDLMVVPLAGSAGTVLIFLDTSSNYKILEMGKEFISNASHELRTPITIIKGFAETLRDLPQISEDMLGEIIEKIVRNCHRMNNLVKNLLLLTDLDYLSRAHMKKNDLIAIIENCCHILLSVHPDTRIETLFNKENIQISADGDLFELAIYNLLENAVKYSSNASEITILMEENDHAIQISIQDRGKGIPKKDIAHIFDRFYTVNKPHSRKLGGAGLGLSIVKSIIEKHEGTIEASSELGKGTTFQIRLPIPTYK